LRRNQLILGLVVLAALAALIYWGRNRIHFDFGVFRSQLVLADWRKIGIAAACIYLGYVIRSVRWALLLRHNKKVPPLSLLGTQVIGFTAVALIGRVADLVRPYLVAKKTGLPISSQVAVYIVERLFDAGSMAMIFSCAIVFTPAGALPHAELVKKAGYGFLAVTMLGAIFLVAVRLAGGAVASLLERAFGIFSKKLGHAVGAKIRTFRTGLDTIRSFADFAVTSVLSIIMWVLIALAYLETMRAFVASPQLASITPAQCVLLLAISGGASVVQLPVLGWFTQIGVVAAAIASFFGAAPEASTACAATLLLVSFLGIVPVGLIWAQFEHVSLRKVAAESGHAGEELSGTVAAEFPD
jgi:uncharacterized membrane protein YbhN (UPF0104 family)